MVQVVLRLGHQCSSKENMKCFGRPIGGPGKCVPLLLSLSSANGGSSTILLQDLYQSLPAVLVPVITFGLQVLRRLLDHPHMLPTERLSGPTSKDVAYAVLGDHPLASRDMVHHAIKFLKPGIQVVQRGLTALREF